MPSTRFFSPSPDDKRPAAAIEPIRLTSELLADASHEIRTPLAGILGLLGQLLESEGFSPRQREQLEAIRRCSGSLMNVLDDLREAYRSGAGRPRIEPTDFDPALLMSDVREIFEPLAAQKGVSLHSEAELPPRLVSDPHRIRQIVSNFVSNAIKFTEAGQVRLLASWRAFEAGGWLRIEVRDTGKGIPGSARERIFQRGFRVEMPEQGELPGQQGSGLGLSICRRLAERMGGRVGFTPTEGEGTCFWAELPASLPVAGQPARQEVRVPVERISRRVLVVDDDEINRAVVRAMLEKLGHEVATASSSEEAVAALFDASTEDGAGFDAVLMDCQMPGMDGCEATRIIRSSGTRVPIIALTADVFEGAAERCRQAGMDDFLSKPVDPDELAAAIDRCGSSPGLPVLDAEAIHKLQALMPPGEFAGQVIRVFFVTSRINRKRIREAVVLGDLRTVGRMAHRMRSGASSLGLARLSSVLEDLEGEMDLAVANPASRTRIIESAAELIARLDVELEQALAELSRYL